MFLLQKREAVPVGGLAIEVNRQNRPNGGPGRRLQARPGSCGIQVERLRIDIRKQRLSAGAQNGADRGEEAEGGGDDGIARTDARRFERQPQGIRARGAADRVGHAAFLRGGALKLRHLGAQNEIL